MSVRETAMQKLLAQDEETKKALAHSRFHAKVEHLPLLPLFS